MQVPFVGDDPTVITTKWAAILALCAIGLPLVILHRWIGSAQGPVTSDSDLVTRRRHGVKGLIVGADGRASTSRTQAALWTLAVLYAFAFLLLWGRSTKCPVSDEPQSDRPLCQQASEHSAAFSALVSKPLDASYYVLLGLPVSAAVAAQALTSSKVANGELLKAPATDAASPPTGGPPTPKQEGPVKTIADIISNDNGDIDLLDFQYFAFNLLTLAYFFVQFFSRPGDGLPILPGTLLGLSGLSVSTYTVKKALETDVKPAVSGVSPARIPRAESTVITIRGQGFGDGVTDWTQPHAQSASLDGIELTPSTWSDTLIVATIPSVEGLPSDDAGMAAAQLKVIDGNGASSDGYSVALFTPAAG